MLIVRPAHEQDLPMIEDLYANAERISSSLPRDRDTLKGRLRLAWWSLAETGSARPPAYRRLLFVMEDTTRRGELMGLAGLDACAGNGEPFYNYRRDRLVHASRRLDISRDIDVLYPTHALTGTSLLNGFAVRRGVNEFAALQLLIRCRLLFVLEHRNWFHEELVVEFQGLSGTGSVRRSKVSEGGQAVSSTRDIERELSEMAPDLPAKVPFWDGLGRHFFGMEYAEANRHSRRLSKTFLAELMPPHPIYETLLDESAREAIGRHHPATSAARAILEREGFASSLYIDIFDGGPVLECPVAQLRSLKSSTRFPKVRPRDAVDDDEQLLSTGRGKLFRAVLSAATPNASGRELYVPSGVCKALDLSAGQSMTMTPLFASTIAGVRSGC